MPENALEVASERPMWSSCQVDWPRQGSHIFPMARLHFNNVLHSRHVLCKCIPSLMHTFSAPKCGNTEMECYAMSISITVWHCWRAWECAHIFRSGYYYSITRLSLENGSLCSPIMRMRASARLSRHLVIMAYGSAVSHSRSFFLIEPPGRSNYVYARRCPQFEVAISLGSILEIISVSGVPTCCFYTVWSCWWSDMEQSECFWSLRALGLMNCVLCIIYCTCTCRCPTGPG